MRKSILAALAVVAAVTPATISGQVGGSWPLPVGVPTPSFGIGETAPSPPQSWFSPVPGFYYVSETASNAVDDGNPFGSPALPRRTIPDRLPAGAVVEVHGTYSFHHTSPRHIISSGTAERPVFIRGAGAQQRPRMSGCWEVSGSYFVIEYVQFEGCGGFVFVDPTHHAALRDSDLSGSPGGGGVGLQSWHGGTVSDVVVLRNRIHDMGDVSSTVDQDSHGIAVGARVSQAWILENFLYGNSGDGLQINAGNRMLQATTHHIYVGRNVATRNRQNGLWTKQATDVIFSENRVYDHHPSQFSLGVCMGGQYAPEHVWFINNLVWNCDYGIQLASDSDQGDGRLQFIIGNVIAAIHDSDGDFNSRSAWQNCGISLPGGTYRFVTQNSMYDVDSGICVPGNAGVALLYDNLIERVRADGHHIFMDSTLLAQRSVRSSGNFFAPEYRVSIGGRSNVYRNGGGPNSVVPSVGYVDPNAGDLRLSAGSPAIGAGHMRGLGLWEYFEQRYRAPLSRDVMGNDRRNASDSGAFAFRP